MSNYDHSPFAETCRLIERAGVDPRSVALDPPLTLFSYWTFDLVDGKKALDGAGDKARKTKRSWPQGWGWSIWAQFQRDSRTPLGRYAREDSRDRVSE